METSELNLSVNGAGYRLQIAPEHTLLAVLRDQLGLVGAKEGCGIGVCGACTGLVADRAISSCLMLAIQAEGHEVTTIEGLAQDGQLHPVQQAYLEHAAFQCAYCTPGFILSTVSLLNEKSDPDDETIRAYLGGNLCRCGSYKNILEAVRSLRRPA
jgi:aerobic-type carbon monoxide dehydrogenase small subunit (CoxS/CutS family)